MRTEVLIRLLATDARLRINLGARFGLPEAGAGRNENQRGHRLWTIDGVRHRQVAAERMPHQHRWRPDRIERRGESGER